MVLWIAKFSHYQCVKETKYKGIFPYCPHHIYKESKRKSKLRSKLLFKTAFLTKISKATVIGCVSVTFQEESNINLLIVNKLAM